VINLTQKASLAFKKKASRKILTTPNLDKDYIIYELHLYQVFFILECNYTCKSLLITMKIMVGFFGKRSWEHK